MANESFESRASHWADNGIVKFLERLVTGLTLAGMLWLIQSVSAANTKLAVLSERLSIISQDPYTGSEASRDFANLRQADDEFKRRLLRLETRLDEYQREINGFIRDNQPWKVKP